MITSNDIFAGFFFIVLILIAAGGIYAWCQLKKTHEEDDQ